MTEDPRNQIRQALYGLVSGTSLGAGAKALFNALGYRSERTLKTGSVANFLESLGSSTNLTEKQTFAFNEWQAVEVVFQFTEDEVKNQADLFAFTDFSIERYDSFLFLAVEMNVAEYSRTHLADATRAVNKLFAMPVIVLFRYGSTLTFAAIHRRAHKVDDSRDVLDQVSLIKDIRTKDPHRAHLDILAELTLPRMVATGVNTFEKLHLEWERVLDIEELNRRFYRELFEWFERAVNESTFPNDGAGEGSQQRHVIRLITRLLFIWFMKEKGLVPGELFSEQFAKKALTNHEKDKTDYYRAVLQNLFFATLNTEITKRAFSKKSNTTHRDFSKFRYRKLLADPERFVKNLSKVPFVNGGLFDCLDDFLSASAGGRRIDAFTDNIETHGKDLNVPARLFFDPLEGLFTLFHRYKFTVEENTPLDREVALDPELLGRVFENLLAAYNPETRETARKSTGSYYTPRQVVDYMVREVLTEALVAKTEQNDGDKEFCRERLQYLFDYSDAMNDADELFEECDRRTVVAAIADMRVLDPAVGSGAFPMGVLQTLTLALRRLDPDNSLWEEFQKARARTRAGQAFDTRDRQTRNEELYEISSTFDKYRDSDFGRKLYLIQNSIYGVDIQPIACQIAKLRFFISLVIEQTPDKDAPNLGIKPLPNLETRFVAADTLLKLEQQAQRGLGQTLEIQALENDLATNREKHFHAGSRKEKLRLRDRDEKLRNSLAEKLAYIGFDPGTAGKIAHWDPFDQNACADWFDPNYMFGVSEGFDVIIGNPPYIQLQKDRGRARRRYQNEKYETCAGTGDIYQLFYERGCDLLKTGTGMLSYITSNSWLKAEYGKPLRRWFTNNHTPLRLIEMGKDVFEAIVDTSILIVKSSKGSPVTCRAVDIEQAGDSFPPPANAWGTLNPEGDKPWMALTSVERSILEKIEAVGTPLKDWDISIYYGIKTGFNDAFIVSTSVRDRLIEEDPASQEILKPILRGRDIARYRANWADLWLISTFPSLNLDIDAFPAIKRHLLSFGKDRLAQEGRRLPGGGSSRKKTPNAWYELQDTCAYHEEFSRNKIFWMHMSPYGRFALGEQEIMCNQKCFMITGKNLEYLCAVLNSTLITWLVRKTSVTTGMGLCQWDKFIVDKVPVIHPDDSTITWFNEAVRKLLDSIDDDNLLKMKEIQREIDQAVLTMYGLTTEEIEKLAYKTNS